MEVVLMLVLEATQVCLFPIKWEQKLDVCAGHGGFGFTSRMWGLTLDVVEAADIVLANGTLAHVSKTQNSDLLWVCKSHIWHNTPLS